jgi:hypothetical protein
LDTNVPFAAVGAGLGLAAFVAAAALSVDTPYSAAPATPPMSIDPAIAADVTAIRTLFMTADSSWLFSLER